MSRNYIEFIKMIIKSALTSVIAFLMVITLSNASSLTDMVNSVLDGHEDIVNAKKELEEAGRDVTDAQLAYAPDLGIKAEAGRANKFNVASASQKNFKTFDLTWDQKIMDSGATMADIRSANLKLDKAELEYISSRNDLMIEAAEAYLGLIKAGEKLETSIQAEANTRQTSGQEEIRVQVGSGLASDVLKSKRQLANAQKSVISDEKSYKSAIYTYEKVFDVDEVNVDVLSKPRLAPGTLELLPDSMKETVSLALLMNRDLLISAIDVKVARNDVSSALANFGPTVDAALSWKHKDDASHTDGNHLEEEAKVTIDFPLSGIYMEMPSYQNDRSALDRAINDHAVKERDTIKSAKDAWQEYANARTMLSYSENEAAIAKELLSISMKERESGQTDAAAVLAAEETLSGAMNDLSDDSMTLVTSVYELLDVINMLEPDMIEDTRKVGSFNTSTQ